MNIYNMDVAPIENFLETFEVGAAKTDLCRILTFEAPSARNFYKKAFLEISTQTSNVSRKFSIGATSML